MASRESGRAPSRDDVDTARLRAEVEDLRARLALAEQAQRRLATVLEVLPVGVYFADGSGRIESLNPAGRRIWGEVPAVGFEHYGEYRAWRVETGERIRAEDWALARAIRAGETTLAELLQIERFDGVRRLILNSAVPIRSEDGTIQGGVAVNEDVTARYEAEGARDRLSAQLSAVLGSMTGGVVVYEKDGRVAWRNRAAEEILGLPTPLWELPLEERLRREALADADGRPLPAEVLPQVRALRGETVQGVLLSRPARHGRPTWFVASAAPIAPAGAVLSLVDVTETRSVAEQREELLRTISHDLRTPLSALLLQAQLMQRVLPPEDPNQHRVDRIIANGQRIAGMIRDLMDMARLESGQVRLECRPLDLGEFFAELCERLAGTLDVDRVRITCAPGLPAVPADADRLERVFCNLIGNALKYSPAGSEVLVSCGPEPDGVRVTVADEGPGIETDELPRLFQRYFRTRQAQSTEGLGLGLHISALIVRAHGGSIDVDSEPGRGSRFHVTLPLAARGPRGPETR